MSLVGKWERSPRVIIGDGPDRMPDRHHCFMGNWNIGHVWSVDNGGLKAWMAYSSFAGKLTIEGSQIDPPYATMEQAQAIIERYAREVYSSLATAFRLCEEEETKP